VNVRGLSSRPAARSVRAGRRTSLAFQRLHALSARVNLPLLAIVAAGTVFTAYYTREVTEWSVMTDELLYVKLALSIGDTGSPFPQIHGEGFAVFSQLYPLLTAPVYQFFDMPSAFRAVHLLNALIMASTAIPAYLLAREVVADRASAYLVAAFTVALPWMAVATMILTEVAAYPAFIWAVLAMQRAIVRPSISRDLLALGAIALAFLGRTQFIALAPILVVAIVAHEAAFEAVGSSRVPVRRALRVGLRRFWDEHRVVAITGAAAVAVAIPALVQGALSEVLGNYEAATDRSLLPDGILHAAAIHLDSVVVAIGIVPFVLALAWVLGSFVRPTDKTGHSFAVLLTLTVTLFTFQVSSFDLNFSGGDVQDRYLFYIAPLLAVGMCACLRASRDLWPAILVAGFGFAAIVGLADYIVTGGPFFGSPSSAFYPVLDGRSYSLGRLFGVHDLSAAAALTAGTVLLTIGLAAAVRHAPGRVVFWVVGLAVLAFCVVETRYVFGRIVLGSEGNSRALSGRPLEGRDWIDDVVAGRPSVAMVPGPITTLADADDPRSTPSFMPSFESEWWYVEAWNKSVDRAFSFERQPIYTPFPRSDLRLDFSTGRLLSDEQSPYLVMAASDPRFRPVSRLVAEDVLQLLRVPLPYRAEWATRRVRSDGWTRPGTATVRVYKHGGGATGRRVDVTFFATADLKGARRYSISSASARRSNSLRPGETRTESIRVCLPRGRFADLKIDVPRTSRLEDGRLVGLQIVQIETRPSGADC
jgi:dolichyl-phosphate-mannose-protein mannosyltransferase